MFELSSCATRSLRAVGFAILATLFVVAERAEAQDQACARIATQLDENAKSLTLCRQTQTQFQRDARAADSRRITAENALEEAEAEVKKHKEALDQEKNKSRSLEMRVQDFDSTIRQQGGDMARLERERDDWKEKEGKQRMRADQLKIQYDTLLTKDPELRDRLEELTKEVEDKKKALDAANTRQVAAVSERNEAFGRARAIELKLEAEQNDHGQTKSELAGIKTALARSENVAKRQRDDVDRLEARIRLQSETISSIESQIGTADATLLQEKQKVTSLTSDLNVCKADSGRRSPPPSESSKALAECQAKTANACPDDGTRAKLAFCEMRLKRYTDSSPSDVAWRTIVEQDVGGRFADIRPSPSCESFKVDLDSGDLVLTGKLSESRNRAVRDRVADISRILPSLKIRQQIDVVAECPVMVDDTWRVVQRGGAPWAMMSTDLPSDLRQSLPNQAECEALGPKLEQQRLIGSGAAAGLWARDDDGILGLCQRQGARWYVQPASGSRYTGLVLRKGKEQ